MYPYCNNRLLTPFHHFNFDALWFVTLSCISTDRWCELTGDLYYLVRRLAVLIIYFIFTKCAAFLWDCTTQVNSLNINHKKIKLASFSDQIVIQSIAVSVINGYKIRLNIRCNNVLQLSPTLTTYSVGLHECAHHI